MSAFNTATAFFHACESLKGWEGCSQYVADNAVFSAQSEPLTDISTVEGYCEWMKGLGEGPLVGCSYELVSSSFDKENNTALFFGEFTGKHTGEGGPVAATGKETTADYVYALKMNGDGKVVHMTKIWNAPWTLRALGWMD